MAYKPPKPWTLTDNETKSSFANWQSNQLYHLSLNNDFSTFIADDFAWQKKSVTNRGLADDAEGTANRKTAVQKNIQLESMLSIIAQFCPSLLRGDVIKKSTSLKWIWQRVRKHYSFSQSEVNFLKLSEIHREPEERYETFYQRIVAHLDDNLLTAESGITHDGEIVTTNEEMSPTTERLAVYLWLTLIDSRLPAYVSRVYAHDLASRTCKEIQPQICEAMDSLLAELSAQEDSLVQYSRSTNSNRSNRGTRAFNNNNNSNFGNSSNRGGRNPSFRPQNNQQGGKQKTCILCKAAGRTFQGHDISSCWFISKFDKMEIVNAFQVETEFQVDFGDGDGDQDSAFDHENQQSELVKTVTYEPQVSITETVRRVRSSTSPFFFAFYEHHVVKILVDSGATSTLVSGAFSRKVGLILQPTQQGAKQLDKSPLAVSGEVSFNVSFGDLNLKVSGLVNDSLDYDILAGVPFCEENNIDVLLSRKLISIHGKLIPYGSKPESFSIPSIALNQPYLV